MPDGVDGGPEQGQVVESMQMRETKNAIITILNEPDTIYDSPQNVDLKNSWINFAKEQLLKPTPEGPDVERVASPLDASLGNQEQRGFASRYLTHMGSPIDVLSLKDIVSGKTPVSTIDPERLNNPDGPGMFWVADASGKKKLFSRTKLDGVLLELDVNGITAGPETIGFVHPTLHIKSK